MFIWLTQIYKMLYGLLITETNMNVTGTQSVSSREDKEISFTFTSLILPSFILD